MLLNIRGLKKDYGHKTILDIPEFALEKGIYWLKGPNGAGKTTLSKIISGIIPSEGDLTLTDEISLKKHPNRYRMLVNYAEAEPLYPGFLTAADLIGFYSQTKKASNKQIEKLSFEFGIERFMNQPCGTYSSGMLKRLSLMLAFLGNPVLMILDEPHNSLDGEARAIVNRLIDDHHKANQVSYILASHEDIEIKPNDVLMIQNQKLTRLEP